MKRLLFALLVLLPVCSHAQNWQSVGMHNTTYYTIPSANDYLRVIWIDSATASGSDSVFHFYPSMRQGTYSSPNQCIDTLGPTWLGKNFIKKFDGDELFFNRWLDTILFKPKASLSASWTMFTDATSNEFFATVTQVDTMTIDNQLDSIKEITITVMNSSVPVTSHVHHNKKIILSKEHGFIECLEWYGFPNEYIDTLLFQNYFPGTNTDEWFANYAGIHVKLDKSFNYLQPYRIDPQIMFKPGNEYHTVRLIAPAGVPNIFVQYSMDSIIMFQNYSTDSVIVTHKKSFYDGFNNYQIIAQDTINLGARDSIISIIKPELKVIGGSLHALPNYTVSPFNQCGIQYKLGMINHRGGQFIGTSPLDSCARLGASLSGWNDENLQTLISLGRQYYYTSNGFTPNSQTFYDTLRTVYYKIDTCTFGTPINYLLLSSKDVALENDIIIFPNPTDNKIFFEIKNHATIHTVNLFSIQGKKVTSCKNCTELNTATITNGIYILNIETKSGIIRKKIVVQH